MLKNVTWRRRQGFRGTADRIPNPTKLSYGFTTSANSVKSLSIEIFAPVSLSSPHILVICIGLVLRLECLAINQSQTQWTISLVTVTHLQNQIQYNKVLKAITPLMAI